MTAHLRTIDTADLPTQTLRDQPAPMLQWVPLAALRIDTRYQRPLEARSWQAITRIAQNFDWSAFSAILCAPIEGGLYAVMDGQHRAHAAALCGIESLPAMIVPVPPQQQAMAFVQINSGIRVTPHQTFRAELAAGHPEALAIARACTDAGCEAMTFSPTAKARRPRQIYCIGLLRQLVRAGHAPHLTAALRALVAYDTRGRTALFSDYILAPLTAAAVTCQTTDPATLTRALQLRDPFTALEAAERLADTEGKPRAEYKRAAMARLIRTAAEEMEATR